MWVSTIFLFLVFFSWARKWEDTPSLAAGSLLWWALGAVAAALFLPRLHVSTDRNLLSGKDNKAFIRRDEVSRLFGTTLVSVVVLSGQSAESVRAAADDLAVRLGEHPDIIRDVFHRADIGFFEGLGTGCAMGNC